MSGYIESYRGQVLASECNFLGHMNIQFYAATVSHAIWNICYMIGIPAADIKAGKRALVSVQQEISFEAELLAGDIIHMETAALGTSDKTLTLQNKLFNSATGELAMVNIMTAAYMDLDARKAIPLTLPMREKIKDLTVETEDVA